MNAKDKLNELNTSTSQRGDTYYKKWKSQRLSYTLMTNSPIQLVLEGILPEKRRKRTTQNKLYFTDLQGIGVNIEIK